MTTLARTTSPLPAPLRGAFTALVTPYTADGRIDEAEYRRLVAWQVLAGIHGLVPVGTTGEAPTLSPAERDRLIEIAVATVAERSSSGTRIPVIAGTGTNDTRASIEATRRAAALGADAALVVTPYYNRPDQRMLDAHFRAIADEGGLPIVVYTVPSRTGANVEADTFLRLAEHERVVAVKEASGNIEQIAVICRDRPRDVAVLAGDDVATLAVLAMGGDGVVSVAGNEIPAEMSALVTAALAGDWSTARRIHDRWLPLFRANFQGAPNPVPVKAAMVAMGLLERDDLRAPLLTMADQPRDRLTALLRRLGLVDGGGRQPAASAAVPAVAGGAGVVTALGASAGTAGTATSILDDLDAGRRRAAVPDPSAPGGWRADPEVKAAILACFGDRRTVAREAGEALQFRDRVGLPPKRLLDGPEATEALEAGRPWRIVPGGTSVRAGVHLGPGVVVMPPSFVNVGAWIGEDTMVDSHVLVGSCAQIGARVHLAAGVSIGGVLEPPGARPVIVEDDAFVGAGSSLLDGVLVGAGAVIGAGVVLTGTSRLYDLVRDRVLAGTPTRRSPSRRGPWWCPGRARSTGRSPLATGCRGGRAAREGPRRGDRRPRRPGARAAMSHARLLGPPRPAGPPAGRDRPPARNEILRGGRLGGPRPGRARRAVRDAVLRLRPRRGRPAGRRAAGRPSARRSTSPTRSRRTRTSRCCGISAASASAQTSRPAASSGTRCEPGSRPTAS